MVGLQWLDLFRHVPWKLTWIGEFGGHLGLLAVWQRALSCEGDHCCCQEGLCLVSDSVWDGGACEVGFTRMLGPKVSQQRLCGNEMISVADRFTSPLSGIADWYMYYLFESYMEIFAILQKCIKFWANLNHCVIATSQKETAMVSVALKQET